MSGAAVFLPWRRRNLVRYESAGAFRSALEVRLNASVTDRTDSLLRLRKLVTFERLVARIQSGGDERWLLKGGFALQLRVGERARTTRDVDLSANLAVFGTADLAPQQVGEILAEASARDLGDFFVFEIGACRELALKVGPVRAYRYPVNSLLAGRTFERFHIDAGVGDPVVGPLVDLPSSGRLDFADIPPTKFRAIAPEQHFAEKMHAMTLPREGAENSRTRDLADVMILLDLGLAEADAVRQAVHGIFGARKTHDVPADIDAPPEGWKIEYEVLANELNLAQRTMDEALERLRAFWKGLKWRNE